MQTILGTVDLLKATSLDLEQQEYVRQIAFSTDIIFTLANDILDMEKFKTGNIRLENIAFSLHDVVEMVLNLVSIEAYNKGLELICDIDDLVPDEIYGDPTRLQQILLNLAKNAVKFTHEGGVTIRLSIDAAPGKDMLLFQVIDTGIGVSDEKKRSIFEPFIQADDSTTRQYGGTGLGLSICQQLVQLMDGSLDVGDNPGGGSIFRFSIPFVARTQHPCRSEPSFPPDHRILIVDDNRLHLENIEKAIKRITQWEVVTATSGPQALATMRERHGLNTPFDLVLIDMNMPQMDGWRLSREINRDPTINGAKLYLMIPEGQLGGEAKMKLLSWFNGYIYKPIQRKKLRELLGQTSANTLELPTVEEQEPETASTRTAPMDTRILVVDDHPVNLKILTKFITDLGFQAEEAASGQKAIDIVTAAPETKLIFMDIEMPGMNGFEASRKIRQLGFAGTIIACSANSGADLQQEFMEWGIDDYLVKPFKKQQLSALIEKWLQGGA